MSDDISPLLCPTEHEENRLLIIRCSAKTRCRQFSNKFTAQEKTTQCCVQCTAERGEKLRNVSQANTHVTQQMLKSCGIKRTIRGYFAMQEVHKNEPGQLNAPYAHGCKTHA